MAYSVDAVVRCFNIYHAAQKFMYPLEGNFLSVSPRPQINAVLLSNAMQSVGSKYIALECLDVAIGYRTVVASISPKAEYLAVDEYSFGNYMLYRRELHVPPGTTVPSGTA